MKLTVANERTRTYWLFVLPALAVYLVIFTLPVFVSVGMGFTHYNAYRNEAVFIGFENFVKMFNDPFFWISLKNNLLVVLVSILGQIPLGFVLAYILFRRMVRFAKFFQAMVFLPITISSIVVGLLWRSLFAPSGVITHLARLVRGDMSYILPFHTQAGLMMVPIGLALIWFYTGLYMIIFLANLQKLDPEIIEAAKIDGASEWRILWKIITPALSGVIVTTIILAISGSLKSFDMIFAMTGGGPARQTELLSIYMYNHTFRWYDFGFGASVSTIMIVISLVLIAITRALDRKYGGKE